MKREEAYVAMAHGKQVKHPFWPGKVLHMKQDRIRVVSTGYGIHYEFLNNPNVEDGWELV